MRRARSNIAFTAITTLGALAVVGAGCGSSKKPTADSVISELAPVLTPKFTTLKAIAAALPKLDPAQRYAGPALDMGPGVNMNTTLTYAADLIRLETITQAPPIPFRHSTTQALPACYYAVAKSQAISYNGHGFDKDSLGMSPTEISRSCEALGAANYLAVVVPIASDDPRLKLGADYAPEAFQGGMAEGVLMVFSLTTGEYHGAKPFSARSEDQVGYRSKSGDDELQRSAAASNAVRANLEAEIYRAINAQLGH